MFAAFRTFPTESDSSNIADCLRIPVQFLNRQQNLTGPSLSLGQALEFCCHFSLPICSMLVCGENHRGKFRFLQIKIL